MTSGNQVKKNAYIYFAGRLMLFLLILFALDFSIGSVLRHFYFTQESGRQYRATYAIDKTTDDILIFGSSRAYHHYVPSLIEDSLKQTCYNTGSPGQFLLYNYATLKAVLARYAPKLVILDVSAGDLSVGRESYDRLSFLLPYYRNHKEIRPIVDLKSPLEKYKLLSSIYAFNSSFLMIAGGNSEYFKKKAVNLKGYKPLTRVWNEPIKIREIEKYKLDSIKVKVFESFIKDCKDAGSKLVLVCSPLYGKYQEKDYSISVMERFANEHQVDFFDFSNDTSFINHPDLFDDPGHLNDRGARMFTCVLLSKIKHAAKSL